MGRNVSNNKEKNQLDNDEALKNLLIIMLLKDGIHPKIIEIATGIAEKTIRNKFPMSLIKGGQIFSDNKSNFGIIKKY